jgi:hypothetical protein
MTTRGAARSAQPSISAVVRIVEPYVNESVSYVNDAVLNVNSAGFDAEVAADARTLEDRPDLRP